MASENTPFSRLQIELANLIARTSAGERLPSEPKLASMLGVSRATLREAMRTFEGQGLIRRKQGQGTFVVGRPKVIESGLEVLESIETLARKIDLKVSMGEVKVEMIKTDMEQAQALGVTEGVQVIRVDRVIYAENRPVARLVDVLPCDVILPEELKQDFTGSVLDFLLRRGVPALSNSRTEIRAVAASPEVARALQIQRGDVLLQFIARLFDVSGRVVDYSLSYFLPGYFRFHVIRKLEKDT
ncbi:MAG: GntR family transcriptional regulator [Anaerolineae bacterium]|nr:GntR family transcriptional regulator [Anaerolineae bacterium]